MGDSGHPPSVSWVTLAAIIIALAMIAQQLLITYKDRNDQRWPSTVDFYRRQFRSAIRVGAILWVALAAVMVYEALAKSSNTPILEGYGTFLTASPAPSVLLITAYFAGCIRLFVEHLASEAFLVRAPAPVGPAGGHRVLARVVDLKLLCEMWHSFTQPEQLIRSDDQIALTQSNSLRRHDAWLWWFVLTTLCAAAVTFGTLMSATQSAGSTVNLRAAQQTDEATRVDPAAIGTGQGEGGEATSPSVTPPPDSAASDPAAPEPTADAEAASDQPAPEPTADAEAADAASESGAQADEDSSDAALPQSKRAKLLLSGFLVNTVGLLGYLSWLYVGLFTKLTEVHTFSGKMARYIIGNYRDTVTPRQVVLIGPKQSGKTVFARANTASPPEEHAAGTRRLCLRMYTSHDERAGGQVVARVSTIDTPGENVGDHLLIAARYRADTLVLILDASKLDADAIADHENFAAFEVAFRLFGTSGKSIESQYLRALWYATNRDPESLSASEVFGVRTFVLYLNHRNSPHERKMLERLVKDGRLGYLAELIGSRFGVRPDNCCAIGGQAPLAGQGRDILGFQSAVERRARASWTFDAVQDSDSVGLQDAGDVGTHTDEPNEPDEPKT